MLFKTTRYLIPYLSKHGHQVFIRVRTSSGYETIIPVYDYVNHKKIIIRVEKEHWVKGCVTAGEYHISICDLNNLISRVEFKVNDAVNELIEKNIAVKLDNIIKLIYVDEENA